MTWKTIRLDSVVSNITWAIMEDRYGGKAEVLRDKSLLEGEVHFLTLLIYGYMSTNP